MDALLLAVFDEVVALEDGVTLDLVSSGDNAGAVDESLELLFGQRSENGSQVLWKTNMLNLVVGDTDGAGLALGKLGHGWHGIS